MYIDKELSINERIEQERFATVASLVSRPDCVVVSSVSCIYGLNAPETFLSYHCRIHVDQVIEPIDLVRELVALQYERTSTDLEEDRYALEEKTSMFGCRVVMTLLESDLDSMALNTYRFVTLYLGRF